MHTERLSYLLKQLLGSEITAAEQDELMTYLAEDGPAMEMQRILEIMIDRSPADDNYKATVWEPLFRKVMGRRFEEMGKEPDGMEEMFPGEKGTDERMTGIGAVAGRRPARRIGGRWPAAAALLLLLAGGAWLFFYKNNVPGQRAPVSGGDAIAHDARPGTDKAILTLADGSTIDLDSAGNGLVGRQGSAQLVKSNGAQLAYRVVAGGKESIDYNLLTTPRGGQYRLVLPDGSKVWINAASSLRYPTSFAGSDRVVELRGEAYFEVVKNAARPFRVKVLRSEAGSEAAAARGETGERSRSSDTMQVEVLGTHFNIMAYGDEPVVNTTLLEGAVRVCKGNATVLLQPGEQAGAYSNGSLKVKTVDTQEAVAWKDGMFKFNEADIGQVMRQLARWYDLEVVYVNGAPKDLFRGEMYRNVNVSKIFRILEASGVHFRIEGKKIMVQSE